MGASRSNTASSGGAYMFMAPQAQVNATHVIQVVTDCKSHFPYIAVPGILLLSLVEQTRHIEHDTSVAHSFVTGSHAPGTKQMHHGLCGTFGCFAVVLHFVNNDHIDRDAFVVHLFVAGSRI